MCGSVVVIAGSIARIGNRSPEDGADRDPLAGWEVQKRETAMVAGCYLCGLGDAAASLVGRRDTDADTDTWHMTVGKSIIAAGVASLTEAVLTGGTIMWWCGGALVLCSGVGGFRW
ncbi:hypothetical protein EYC84_004505 [Monilinia fructicola]|uniref:Uncharacterized protein n=1 Tax=Monilinia fructicola TaxID=38448 RepID=A0A5M9K3I9_MONFR|nr:hypothetical protein EYC84_004505 [Monilinia fructicola]